MKQFFINFCIFLLIIFLGTSVTDFALSYRLRQNKNRMYAAWNQMYNDDTTNYDLLINGPSRAWTQYNPTILDSVLQMNSYNLGIDGSAINRQMIKYNRYRELHGDPKYLIQNIDLGTMATTFGYEREQFFPYFFYDRDLINQYDAYEKFSFAEKYVPCYRYLGYKTVLLEAIFQDNEKHYFEYLYKGYHGRNENWDGSVLANLDSIKCACDTNMVNTFIDFLEVVKSTGTKVIFVYAPIYYVAREKMVNEQQMFEMYDSIASKFDIPILDYNDIPMCYDTTYFYNATHLNKTGAELFTTKLAHDIDSIGFLK